MGAQEGSGGELKQSEGRYANCFKVTYNAFEFLFDFGQCYPDQQTEVFHSRIITAPYYVKVLINMLQQSLASFENEFGPITHSQEHDS